MTAYLDRFGLVYMSSPYTLYPSGREAAHRDACRLMSRLITAGVSAFSPIAHSHGIAVHGGLDPLDHALWLDVDEAMMRVCDALLVAQMPSWRDSYGMRCEIEWFERAGKPVLFLDCETLAVTEREPVA